MGIPTGFIQKFWQFEKEQDFFSWEMKGVYIWNIIRVTIIHELLISKFYKKSFHPDLTSSKFKFLKKKITGIILALKKGALGGKGQYDYIIFESGRRLLKINNHKVCQFTHFLNEDLKQKHRVQLIEKEPYSDNRADVAIDDFFTPILLAKAFFISRTLSKADEKRIDELELLLTNKFGYAGSLFKLIRKKLFYFYYEREQYARLIRKRKPKEVYLINGYNNMSLIAACKLYQVPACELQHGVMTQYSYQYSFAHLGEFTPPYFPDKMHLWGEFWYDITNLPLSKSDIEFKGFEIINQNTLKYKDIVKKENTCTCISQGMISEDMFAIFIEAAQLCPDFTFYYKLHPSESINENKYNEILEQSNIQNVEVVLNQYEIHYLLAISENVIGLYSTALFEAINFDCRIMIFDLPGADYMEYLITNLGVPLFNSEQELAKLLKSESAPILDKSYFFKSKRK